MKLGAKNQAASPSSSLRKFHLFSFPLRNTERSEREREGDFGSNLLPESGELTRETWIKLPTLSLGTYWFKDKATKELTSVANNDINMQKPLPEFLKENDLPMGMFPRDATNYEYNEETKKLVVHIPEVCEVGYKDSSVLRFDKTVSGILGTGKLVEIEGMKTKMLIWIKVTNIASEGPSKLHITAGLKKTRSREAYEVSRDGVIVKKF